MAIQTFTSGQVLTATQVNNLQANDYNITVNVSTGNYTLVVGDRGTRRVANSASAIAFTVNTSVFSAGDTVEIHNIGAGTLTITAGTATVTSADVLTVAQWQGGTLYFTSASAAIWFPRAKSVTPGLTLISTTTIGSAVSSVTVSSAFSSTYNDYKIIVSGGAASASINLTMILGATATGYYAGYNQVTYSTGATTNTGSDNNTTTWTKVAAANTNGISGSFDLLAPNLSKNTMIMGFAGPNDTAGNSRTYSGFLNDTTAYTAFTLTTSSGTITGGTIKVYGYQNS